MSERNNNRVSNLPTVGEIACQLFVTGRLGGSKEEIWQAVQAVAPGYPREAFDRHWEARRGDWLRNR